MSITVVIHTLNDVQRIEPVIVAVSNWADEVLVADMASDDGTQALARRLGARVLTVDRRLWVEPARQASVGAASSEYILLLDADEIAPAALQKRLGEVARAGIYDAVSVPRRNYIVGKALDAAGWAAHDDAQMRFFRKSVVRFRDDIHRGIQLSKHANTLALQCPPDEGLQHFSYPSWSAFVSRMNRYTDVEVERLLKISPAERRRTIARALLEFPDRFVRRGGWTAGWHGFFASWLMTTYYVLAWAKYHQLRKIGSEEAIAESYVDHMWSLARSAALARGGPSDPL